jgi:hypothetical protein
VYAVIADFKLSKRAWKITIPCRLCCSPQAKLWWNKIRRARGLYISSDNMFSENLTQKFHRFVICVRSSAILLKPAVGEFFFLKKADEIVQLRTVTLLFAVSSKNKGPTVLTTLKCTATSRTHCIRNQSVTRSKHFPPRL